MFTKIIAQRATFAKNTGDAGAQAPEVTTPENVNEDVNEDNYELINVTDSITINSINAKPRPLCGDDGKPLTINLGTPQSPNFKVVYPDQELCIMAGRAHAFCYVETDKGTSLELIGEFTSKTLVPDASGVVDVVSRGARLILPNKAEKLVANEIRAQGLVTGMAGDIEANDNGTKRTTPVDLKDAIEFAFIVGAKQSSNATGYEYTVKTPQRAKTVVNGADKLMAVAVKRLAVARLAAPGSELANRQLESH